MVGTMKSVTKPNGLRLWRSLAATACTFFLLAAPAWLAAAIPAEERTALIALYNNTNGDDWTNKTGWKTPPLDTDGFARPGTEGTWHGVTVNSDHVLYLSLAYNKLMGSIPPELGNLTNLQGLALNGNQLTGSIPSQLGNLTNLQELDLGNNQLTGSIPSQLGNLTNLLSLALFENQLTGGIPTELGNLTNLQGLHLDSNQLTGTVPSQLGNLTNLQQLALYNNKLTGSIPTQLGNLINLKRLWLSNNQLTGGIPAELGNLTNLQHLWLSSNQLTGGIPAELGNLTNLQCLWLSNNQLAGSIPSQIGNLANLLWLDLGDNQLTGSIPYQIGDLLNLQSLSLMSNQLTGHIPGNLTNLHHLHAGELDLRWNGLHTMDDTLRYLLNSKQFGGDWEGTQTVAPTSVAAGSPTASSLTVTWTPIAFAGDTGGYRVLYSPLPGGPFTLFGMTADKSASYLTVTNLAQSTTYHFVVQTVTDPHSNNQNTVVSEASAPPASGTTKSGCTPPTAIAQEPKDAAVPPGGRATLRVDAEGEALRFQWFRGFSGDASHPVEGATKSQWTTTPLNELSRFWARVLGSCGQADSATATVWVGGDINGNGEVNGEDLTLLRQFLAEALPPGAAFDRSAADLDEDGRVDTVDLTLLSRVTD